MKKSSLALVFLVLCQSSCGFAETNAVAKPKVSGAVMQVALVSKVVPVEQVFAVRPKPKEMPGLLTLASTRRVVTSTSTERPVVSAFSLEKELQGVQDEGARFVLQKPEKEMFPGLLYVHADDYENRVDGEGYDMFGWQHILSRHVLLVLPLCRSDYPGVRERFFVGGGLFIAPIGW